MGLVEQVGYGKGKCLVQSVQEFVSPRGFVKEEGAWCLCSGEDCDWNFVIIQSRR